eukprot:TRINITY_DN24055_c0_g1_i1.p1 TRINITY_DN24055_c0_g1~~TRINITY_DN24055_c0_g1_i1.p1  ORF type:complete len:313 (+),score=35.68 TRINITY_DN24055_c0_g1_i1:150-1088(+)
MRGTDKRETHPVRNLIAGGLAGCCAKTSVAPLDRIKILLQGGHPQFRNMGMISIAREVNRREGLLAFWRGNQAQMLRIFPYAGVQFLVFERAKRFYRRHLGESPAVSFLAGSTAGISAVSCTYPVDFLRARMAYTVGKGAGHSVLYTARHIYQTEGLASFYSGIYPTLVGMIFYAGVSFGVYDYIKHTMLEFSVFQGDSEHHLNTVSNLLCGGLAGTISQTVAYPLDVVRRRMQLERLPKGSDSTLRKYRGIGQTMRLLYAENGLRTLFRGITLNYCREFPQVGIAFLVYERLKVLLKVYKDEPSTVAAATR